MQKQFFLVALRCFVVLVCLIKGGLVFAQNINVSGFIKNVNSTESLIGATVWIEELGKGAVTNNYGFFTISIPKGRFLFRFNYVGCKSEFLSLELGNDTLISVGLYSNNELGEIDVSWKEHHNFLLSPSMSMYKLYNDDICKVPSLLGESDVLKVLQILPGVSMTNEGQSSFSVRGGNPDQTLILLDGVPVYNVNHIFGYMSTFNSDMIKTATIYKGGVPAQFGGRLSSVLDVTSKEGDLNDTAGSFSVGTLAGSLFLNGPIKKGKISYALGARRTWLDLPLRLVQTISSGDDLTYNFWDLNGKVNYRISSKDRIYLSFYSGKDAFQQQVKSFVKNGELDYSFNWRNLTSVFRWNHVLDNQSFLNTSFYVSKYNQEYKNITDKENDLFQKGSNSLLDISLKSDYYHTLSNHYIRMGYHMSRQVFSPEVLELRELDTIVVFNKDAYIKPLVASVYIDDEITLGSSIKINLGLRPTLYHVDKKFYGGIEPRMSMSFMINHLFSSKISFIGMKQYVHRLSNRSIGVPVDMWVSSTKNIRPGTSNLFSSGVYYKPNKQYDFSCEIYYSKMKNVTRYKEGAMYLQMAGHSWENVVIVGDGSSYGIEMMAEKKNGRLTGFGSYTLSKSVRRFDEINNGKPFPYEYDRRHQFKFFGSYDLKSIQRNDRNIKHALSVSFVYLSGNFMTFPTVEYKALNLPYVDNDFSDYNNTRKHISSINNLNMPDFHHLDLSYKIESRKNSRINIWNFGIYNVYNRMNVYYYFKKGGQVKQVTFFPILPSLTFTRIF